MTSLIELFGSAEGGSARNGVTYGHRGPEEPITTSEFESPELRLVSRGRTSSTQREDCLYSRVMAITTAGQLHIHRSRDFSLWICHMQAPPDEYCLCTLATASVGVQITRLGFQCLFGLGLLSTASHDTAITLVFSCNRRTVGYFWKRMWLGWQADCWRASYWLFIPDGFLLFSFLCKRNLFFQLRELEINRFRM